MVKLVAMLKQESPEFPQSFYSFFTSVGIRSDSEAHQWLTDACMRATPPSKLPQHDAEVLLDKLQEAYPHATFSFSTPDYSLRREPRS